MPSSSQTTIICSLFKSAKNDYWWWWSISLPFRSIFSSYCWVAGMWQRFTFLCTNLKSGHVRFECSRSNFMLRICFTICIRRVFFWTSLNNSSHNFEGCAILLPTTPLNRQVSIIDARPTDIGLQKLIATWLTRETVSTVRYWCGGPSKTERKAHLLSGHYRPGCERRDRRWTWKSSTVNNV